LGVKKKIVLLGDSAVGKTSLIRRYVLNQFEESYTSTIGSKVRMKELVVQGPDEDVDLTFMIWDLIGREGYHALHARTFVGVHGAILVADLTRKETLSSLERYWIPFLFKVVENVPLVFVCNKSDLEEQFEFEPEDLAFLASRYNVGLDRIPQAWLKSSYATSAKSGSNVEKAFESLGHMILCSKELVDPVKELYQSVVATGLRRSSEKTTAIGALDAIMVDFCEGFEDSRLAMPILRQEMARASIGVNKPTKEGILKVVEYLAEAENEFKDEKTVVANLKRRLKWADSILE
jgi:small GTP-binding protein